MTNFKSYRQSRSIHFSCTYIGNVSLDLEYYYGKDQVPGLIALDKITPAVREYVDAMESACAKNPALLIAHSYSRYLGDLSGKHAYSCPCFS
jgi:heme oxygenase